MSTQNNFIHSFKRLDLGKDERDLSVTVSGKLQFVMTEWP